jgi:uncharacterized protein
VATIFYDPLSATFYNPDHSRDENRYITIGYSSQNKLLVVSNTERVSSIRIISARLATLHEREKHENNQERKSG